MKNDIHCELRGDLYNFSQFCIELKLLASITLKDE